MLNEKQYRERATRELRAIGNQVQGMVTDRDLYRRLEKEVVEAKADLTGNSNAFLEFVRGAYTDAMTMRLRRLLAPEASLSLRRTIVQLGDYPDLLHAKANAREIAEDAAALDRMAAQLKEQVEPHFLAHERTTGALAPTLRELDRALDLVIEMLQKYYWTLCEGYLDLEAKPGGDPLDVFRKAWVK
jgi:hypothetical protein